MSIEEEAGLSEELARLHQRLDDLTLSLSTEGADAACDTLLCIRGYTDTFDWARDLSFMYGGWAERNGASVQVTARPSFGWSEYYLEIVQAESFAWLQEETGTHRLYLPGLSKPIMATVEVWPSNSERDQEATQNPNIQSGVERSRPARSRAMAYARSTDPKIPSTFSIEVLRPNVAELRARRWVQAELSAGPREQREARRAPRRRTYSLHEERLHVRDHLTGLEAGDPALVLRGQLEPFLRAARPRHLAPLRDVYMIE